MVPVPCNHGSSRCRRPVTEATIGRRPKRATTTGHSAADDNLDDILALGHALPVVGDQWSMFIIREAFRHVRRFSDFRVALDLSDAVLAKRLRDLVEAGVFTTVEYTERPPRVEYCLTEQGRDLWSVFVAIWLRFPSAAFRAWWLRWSE